MQPSAILESALYVTDLDASETFYRDVIGLERIAKVEGRHVFFRCGQGVLLLFNAGATQHAPPPDAKTSSGTTFATQEPPWLPKWERPQRSCKRGWGTRRRLLRSSTSTPPRIETDKSPSDCLASSTAPDG